MISRFKEAVEKLAGAASCRFLLAVSGGADSCVMAHLFSDAGYDFAIAHCNFHLRGEDSNQDMQLVQSLSRELKVQLFVEEFDTLELQKNSGLSIEMMARKLRYDWFNEIGRDFDYIVTAHQANDVAETLLLNICRGTGLKGLTSIPAKNGKIIRPMLQFTAEEIREYAKQNHIPFAIDCTNTDESIKRNRIRGSVLPELAKINPKVVQTMNRDCEILQRQYNFYHHQISLIKSKIVRIKENEILIIREELQKLSDVQVVFYEILKEYNFPVSVVEDIVNNAPKTGAHYNSSTHILLVDRDCYIIREKEVSNHDFSEILIHSVQELEQFFKVEKIIPKQKIEFPKDNKILFVPQNKLVFPLLLRHWKEGDVFYPLGSRGKQKLSDFFTDHKINMFEKHRIQILCSQEKIVWIVGYRSDNRFKVDNNTQEYYKISVYGDNQER